MSNSRTSSIAFALVSSALNRTFGIVGAAQYTPYSKTTIAFVLKEDELWDSNSVIQRASHAPKGSYLAFDFVVNLHSGKEMEGLDYQYSSSHNSTKLAHKFSNVTLVKSGYPPTPIQMKYTVSKNLSTEDYPYLKPIESLKKSVLEMLELGVEFAGVIADGEFSCQEAIRFHKEKNINFLGRIKSNRTVEFEGQKLSLTKLSEKFPYKSCHLDPRVGWRARKIDVKIGELDAFILIIYRKDNGLWKPFFLVSTFNETYSMAELLKIWKSRWGIEVVHRFIKQNLGFSKSQTLKLTAQQNWVNAVLDAFIVILDVITTQKIKSWRVAQQIAASLYEKRAMTDVPPDKEPKYVG